MGWTFSNSWHTKDDVVREILSDGKFVDHSLVGNELWTVMETNPMPTGETRSAVPIERVIVLFLLDRSGGWGYKCMDEGMGPYFYKCPLSFLKLAPVLSESWRAKVREYHGERNAARRARHEAYTSLGMKRVRGSLGGVYYE